MLKQTTRAELPPDSKKLIASSFHLRRKCDEIIWRLNAKPTGSDAASQMQERIDIERHSDILNSWKEIAAYLRRGVRTVQRLGTRVAAPSTKTAA